MKKPTDNFPFDSDTLRFFIKRSEPILEAPEKEMLLESIKSKIVSRRRISHYFRIGTIAASFLLMIIGGWL